MAPKTIDLNAFRAAAAEANADREPLAVAIGDDVYALPLDLPATVMVDFAAVSAGDVGKIIPAIDGILGADVTAELLGKHHLTISELKHLLENVLPAYGLDLGNS